MKPFTKLSFLTLVLFLYGRVAKAQYFASSYKPRNETERMALAKVRALPEVKEWFKTAKRSKPDIEINLPDSTQKYYWFQIGISNFDLFRTSYHLFVDPKTFTIYYNDDMDDSGGKLITVKRWRLWRSKPGFFEIHTWKAGKLVVLKDDQKKSSKSKKKHH